MALPTDEIESPTEEDTDDAVLTEVTEDKSDPDSPETPQYQQKISLNDEQQKRLVDEILEEFRCLKDERSSLGLEEKWKNLQAQYDGDVAENADQQFNLHIHTTKVKIDAIVRAAKRSFLDVSPKYAVTPRPEEAKKDADGSERTCQEQQDFLDYKIDEQLTLEEPLELALYSAAIKAVGILKIPWTYTSEKKRREETYDGKPQIVGVDQQGQPIIKQQGVEDFLKQYPDAAKTHKDLLSKLVKGEKIQLEVEYTEVTHNDPDPQYVSNEDFYCYDFTKGLKGLKCSRIIVERQNLSWRDLKVRAESEGWENVDDIKHVGSRRTQGSDKPEVKENYSTQDYKILECTYFFNKSDSDKVSDETKVKVWIAEERETFLHAIEYPYYGISTEYIPFYIKRTKKTFWHNAASVVSDLTPTNLAENMFLNFMLEAAWIDNTTTPVVKEGSVTEQQLMNKRWTHGVPLVIRRDATEVSKELTFLPKPASNINGIMNVIQYLIKQDDDVTGVSSLMTGRESPIDPRAPATKTLALLKASGLNIEDYIRTLLPSFNEIANVLLQLYYQMSMDSVAYKTREVLGKITGENPFSSISRQNMIAKTNIQCQAFAFNTDKAQEKQDNMALYQAVRMEIATRGDVNGLYQVVRALIKSWSPYWRTRVDDIWPTPEKFAMQQAKDTASGLNVYIQGLLMQSKATGAPVQPQLGAAMDMVKQLAVAKMTGQNIKDGEPKAQNDQVNGAMGL